MQYAHPAIMLKRNYAKWTNVQKQTLETLVTKQKETHKKVSWISIANKVPGKSPRQCYDQWLHIVQQKHRLQNDAQNNQCTPATPPDTAEPRLQHGNTIISNENSEIVTCTDTSDAQLVKFLQKIIQGNDFKH